MLSHQLKQFKINGEKTIIQNPSDAQKKDHEKFEFATHEVYAMDVLISTGEGVVSTIFLYKIVKNIILKFKSIIVYLKNSCPSLGGSCWIKKI